MRAAISISFVSMFLAMILTTPVVYCAKSSKEKADPTETALESFKKKVDQFNKFFSTSPKILHDQPFSDSPTKRVIWFTKCSLVDIGYDVKKTESLISPLTGMIRVKYVKYDNTHLGDVITRHKQFRAPDKIYYYGYTTAEKAKAYDIESSYKPTILTGTTPADPDTIVFHFAYQDRKWVFKTVSSDRDTTQDIFSGLMGLGSSLERHCPENTFWLELTK